jgi:predicted nucleotidyltransferase
MQFVYLVAEVSDPDKIILFGSYAYGKPDDKSDLDLLVIKNGNEITIDDETKYAVAIFNARLQRKIKMKYEVFFKTDKQARIIAKSGGAYRDALEKGRVVYKREHR